MLNKLTIGKKLLLIVAVFSTVVVGMTTYLLMDMRSGMYEDRKAKLRSLIETAVNTVNRYGDLAAAGKMPVEEAQKTALETLQGMNFEGKNYFFVFDRNGILKMHPTRKGDLGHNMLDPKHETSANYIGYLKAASTQPPLEGFSVFVGRRPGSTVNDTPKLFLSTFDKHWDWVVTTGLFIDDVNALFFSRAIWAASAVFAGLVFSLILTLLLGRSITRPLNRTVNALEELGAGRFDADVPDDKSQTEIGRLSRAFLQFRDKMRESEAVRARQHDAERQLEIDRRNTMARVADEFDAAVGSVVESLFAEVKRTGDTVAELSRSAQASAAGTERVDGAAASVSENIQTVASAAQELSASINEIGRQIHMTRDIAQQTRSISTQTEARVAALSDSVEAIGSIPNTEWLDGNGLDLTDGVLCDNTLSAVTSGRPGAPVTVVGDLARFPNPLLDDVPRRVEHWSMPTDTARRAATTLHARMAGDQVDPNPFRPLPYFWSDQGELRLQSFGSPQLADDVVIAEGDLADLDQGLLATYHRGGRLVGSLAVNLPPSRYRELREALR